MFSDTMMLGGGVRKAAYLMENSLLFRGGQHFSRTPSVAGDRQKFTISAWVRRSQLGVYQSVFSACDGVGATDSTYFNLQFQATDALAISVASGNLRTTSALYRDTTAYLHILVSVDTTTQTVNLYVNGDQVTSFSINNAITIGLQTAVNSSACIHGWGRINYSQSNPLNGYIAQPILVDGAALSPSRFGEFDPVTGSWRPKAPVVSAYGTNGFCLGNPWNPASLGADYSGQGNNWTPSGFVASDVMTDTPTNVFATLNPLFGHANNENCTLSNGSRTLTIGAVASHVAATIPAAYGRYCWEVKLDVLNNSVYTGVCNAQITLSGSSPAIANTWNYAYVNGASSKNANGSASAYGVTLSTGKVIGHVLDMTAGTLEFFVDGVSQGVAFTGLTGPLFPYVGQHGLGFTVTINTGQSAFAYPNAYGTAKPINTANLAPTIGATSGSFTGNASADGPCVYTGAVPVTLTINGNAVVWGTHADKLATGFKIRTSSSSYNTSGTNSWTATYNKQPTVGSNHTPANAQIN